MADIEQLQNMAYGGLDATALAYDEGGDTVFYVFLGRSNDVLRYNANTENSTIDHQAPFDAINKKIIQPGGKNDIGIMTSMKSEDSSTYSDGDIIQCDPQNQDYTKIGNIGVYRQNPMAISKNGTVYAYGGDLGGDNPSTEVWNLNTVSKVGDLNQGFAESCVGILSDGTVVNAGGDAATMYEIWEVDVQNATASKLADMTEPDGSDLGFNRAFGGAVGDMLYVFGGSLDGNGYSDKVREIDPFTGETQYVETIPDPIRNTIIGFDGNVLYSFGGKTSSGDTNFAYRVSGLSNLILMLSEEQGLRGGVPGDGKRAVLHNSEIGRVEKKDNLGDPVAILDDGLGQS